MDAKQKLSDIAMLIDRQIDTFLEKEYSTSKEIHPVIKEIFEKSRPMLVDGGKRIRGAFQYYGYLLAGGKDLDEALKTTPFIELIHAYLLIHDDIMDQAILRRGFPTIHKVYENEYRSKSFNNSGSLHFGESIGINIGDILCHLGFQVLTNANFNAELKIKAINKAHRNLADVGYGQVLDVYGEIENVDEEYVLKVHLFKTGYYTYQTPLHIGALLANSSTENLEALTSFALPGGIAYQIIDDIIDLYGDHKKTGKLPGQDIKEGKNTLLIVKAFELGTPEQKAILESSLGNRRLGKATIELVKKIIVETGSLEYSKQKAKELLAKSTEALNHCSKDANQEGIDFLKGINDYMLIRMEREENNRVEAEKANAKIKKKNEYVKVSALKIKKAKRN